MDRVVNLIASRETCWLLLSTFAFCAVGCAGRKSLPPSPRVVQSPVAPTTALVSYEQSEQQSEQATLDPGLDLEAPEQLAEPMTVPAENAEPAGKPDDDTATNPEARSTDGDTSTELAELIEGQDPRKSPRSYRAGPKRRSAKIPSKFKRSLIQSTRVSRSYLLLIKKTRSLAGSDSLQVVHSTPNSKRPAKRNRWAFMKHIATVLV